MAHPDVQATDWTATLLGEIAGLDETTPVRPRGCVAVIDGVPVLTTGQRQGDVFIQPDPAALDNLGKWARRRLDRTATILADRQEVVVVPQGHQHVLVAHTATAGRVRAWGQAYANVVLTIHIEAPAYAILVQPSGPNPHPPLGIGPGYYQVCRQTEPVILAPATRPGTAPMPSTKPKTAEEWRAAQAAANGGVWVVD
jgi:hypothetical protein